MLLLALCLRVQSLCLNQIWVYDGLLLRNIICTSWTHCGVSWCWGIHCWFTFVLPRWCRYCSVSLLSLALQLNLHSQPPLYNSHFFFWHTVHTFTLTCFNLSTTATFLCPQGRRCTEVISTVYQIIGDCMSTTPENYQSVFKWTLMGYLSVSVTPMQVFFWLITQ